MSLIYLNKIRIIYISLQELFVILETLKQVIISVILKINKENGSILMIVKLKASIPQIFKHNVLVEISFMMMILIGKKNKIVKVPIF
jgi:hypothetical protein